MNLPHLRRSLAARGWRFGVRRSMSLLVALALAARLALPQCGVAPTSSRDDAFAALAASALCISAAGASAASEALMPGNGGEDRHSLLGSCLHGLECGGTLAAAAVGSEPAVRVLGGVAPRPDSEGLRVIESVSRLGFRARAPPAAQRLA